MTTKNDQKREPKKTVSIEVRVSEEDKSAFMDACRLAGRSASSALRDLMAVFVVFHRIRHRMFEMMKRALFRPARAALAAIASIAALSASLLLAPTASATMDLAYQVAIDDGAGVIVSQGEADFADNEVITDQLGEDIRFRLMRGICESEDAAECARQFLVLRVSEYHEGETLWENDMGIAVAETGLTTFETQLSDGRTLTLLVSPSE